MPNKFKMRRFSVFLDEAALVKLTKIGFAKGGLKPSQLIRLAISDFIDREEKGKK
jgi:metal-responsive CopG/Arc/MetJ family transcriptional regulator